MPGFDNWLDYYVEAGNRLVEFSGPKGLIGPGWDNGGWGLGPWLAVGSFFLTHKFTGPFTRPEPHFHVDCS